MITSLIASFDLGDQRGLTWTFIRIAFFAFSGIGIFVFLRLPSNRSRAMVDRWAEPHDFDVVSATYAPLNAGPFNFRRTQAQTVFRIVVKDANGILRKGYLRCGSWWRGGLGAGAVVLWDNEGNDQ